MQSASFGGLVNSLPITPKANRAVRRVGSEGSFNFTINLANNQDTCVAMRVVTNEPVTACRGAA